MGASALRELGLPRARRAGAAGEVRAHGDGAATLAWGLRRGKGRTCARVSGEARATSRGPPCYGRGKPQAASTLQRYSILARLLALALSLTGTKLGTACRTSA